MKWKAETAYEAITEWGKKEIVESTASLESLVRFLFTVSATSIMAFVAVSRLSGNSHTEIFFVIAICAYFISIWLLLIVLLRKKADFIDGTDLHSVLINDINYIKNRCWAWSVIWLFALIMSGMSIYA